MTALSIVAAARESPGADALVVDGVATTYRDLAKLAHAHVSAFGGDSSVVVWSPRRTVDDVARIHALLELRRPMALLHPRLTETERQSARRSLAVPPQGTAAILFTSGTEGRPKAAALSRAALIASTEAHGANLPFVPGDRWLLCMPLAHVGGLSILTRCLAARSCVVLAPERAFSPDTMIPQIERDRVTLLSLVPTMLERMLRAGWRPPDRVRAVLLGGAAASARLLERAADAGVPVLTTYGLTETCSQVTTQPPGTDNRGQLGAGRPLPGAEVRVVDGCIQVRGPMLMTGYLDAPSPFTDEGWLETGDLGELDDEGNLHVHTRRTDLIVTGGENVYPAEVEQVLEELDGVRAACVLGEDDEEWGQRVVAVVTGEVAQATLEAFVAERLAPHKRPKRWELRDALPTTASGKIDRRAVRDLVLGRDPS